MGNNQNTCPSHEGKKLTKICMCDACLQPLCSKCVLGHIEIHHKLGYPPKIKDFSSINKQMTKENKVKKQDEAFQQLIPTSVLIKDLTRQYFENHCGKHPAEILQNLQIWKDLHEDAAINRKIGEFLDKNLNTNSGVVGQKFSHLY